MPDVYEPRGIRFYDKATQREMLLVWDPRCSFDGWLCFRHPDGQWVSQRPATEVDLDRLVEAGANLGPKPNPGA